MRHRGWQDFYSKDRLTLAIGTASCGMAAGAQALYQKAAELALRYDGRVRLFKTGCIGFCQMEPLIEVRSPQGARMLYGPVKPGGLGDLLESWMHSHFPKHARLGPIPALPATPPEIEQTVSSIPGHPFYFGQMRVVSRNCGQIDPESISQAIAFGAYQGLSRALLDFSPDEVIGQVEESGLRGRGGAGFPTGKKWGLTRRAEGSKKIVICNADEGDPGAYMDRSLLEGDPHSVLEGMLIGGYAAGADRGIIYIRMEYPLAIERMNHAISEARELGLLGGEILGSQFSFDIDIVEGAGAFVSGEETALIAAIEGRAAEPRPRPPYPATEGLYGFPTIINNVETWANVPVILQKGPAWFSRLGTKKSKGTKVFSLVGAVRNTGLVEVPMGASLKSLVEEIGGGPNPGRNLKAVQTGGPSGGCIPIERLDAPVDYESLTEQGSIMGSGGMVVLDDRSCMVDLARYFIEFTMNESCGKCTPCREGLNRMFSILERITAGEGAASDLAILEDLALGIKDASLCGLGKSAPNPVLTTLRDFREEYLAHILEKRCPAGVCKALITYAVDLKKCTGCAVCVKVCPTGALRGKKDEAPALDTNKCVKCGACREVCRFEAVFCDGATLC